MNTRWLAALSKRTYKDAYVSEGAILKIFSLLSPAFVYIFLNQAVTIIFAYIIGTGQYGTEMSAFFTEHSLLCAAIIRILSVLLAALPLMFVLAFEYPVIVPGKIDYRYIFSTGLLSVSSALFFNTVAINTGFSGSSQSFSQTSANQFSLPIWLGIIVYGIVTPVTEEIVYRGVVYNRARNIFRPVSAMLCSAFLFGFSHGNTVQLVYGFLMGLLICYIYERFGAFIYPVIFHCMANISIYVLLSNSVAKTMVKSLPGMIAEFTVMTVLIIYIASIKNVDTQ